MTGNQFEPGRMQAYGRPPEAASAGPGYGWSPTSPTPAPARPRTSGLAVVAVVMAGLALIAAVACLVFVLGSGPGGPLTGRVAELSASSALTGGVLQDAVTQVIEDDGGDVERLTCPAVPRVDQGVVAVCHGSISGDGWAVVVLFEDATGQFTLVPA